MRKVIIASMTYAAALMAMAHTPVKAGRWKTFTYDNPDTWGRKKSDTTEQLN